MNNRIAPACTWQKHKLYGVDANSFFGNMSMHVNLPEEHTRNKLNGTKEQVRSIIFIKQVGTS